MVQEGSWSLVGACIQAQPRSAYTITGAWTLFGASGTSKKRTDSDDLGLFNQHKLNQSTSHVLQAGAYKSKRQRRDVLRR